MSKPNCYECKHQGSVPGSAHSNCNHPALSEINDDPLLRLIGILGGARNQSLPAPSVNGITVEGNQHGIDSGWFNWPMNFDPVWLEECNGFEERKAK